jgi:hypothetical protein
MRWGSRRDANFRHRIQLLESRIRLSQQALAALRARLVPMLTAHVPIIDATEIVVLLERVENILAGSESGGGR